MITFNTRNKYLQMIHIYATTLPVKSLDLVFFDIEIATLSKFSNFLKEVTIELNRFSHRLVKKNGEKRLEG